MKNSNKKNRKELGFINLANNINKFLILRGWNQTRLARETQLSTGNISDIINGKAKNIEWYTLFVIAEAFECSMDTLVAGAGMKGIDDSEIREIVDSIPPEAKLFFRSTDLIPKENVKVILDLIRISVKDIDASAKKRKK